MTTQLSVNRILISKEDWSFKKIVAFLLQLCYINKAKEIRV